MKKFQILKQNNDCVLLKFTEGERYKVKDIENDDIYSGCNYDTALNIFNTYSIEEVRKQRKEIFEKWLKEFAEA